MEEIETTDVINVDENQVKNYFPFQTQTQMDLLPQFSDPSISSQETKKEGSNILTVLSNLNSRLKHGLNKKITTL